MLCTSARRRLFQEKPQVASVLLLLPPYIGLPLHADIIVGKRERGNPLIQPYEREVERCMEWLSKRESSIRRNLVFFSSKFKFSTINKTGHTRARWDKFQVILNVTYWAHLFFSILILLYWLIEEIIHLPSKTKPPPHPQMKPGSSRFLQSILRTELDS